MDSSLQRLGGLVKGAAGVSFVGSCSGLETVIKIGARCFRFALGIRQAAQNVANSTPGLRRRPGQRALLGFGHRWDNPLLARNPMTLPIVATGLIPYEGLAAMRRVRKRPLNARVRAKANEEYALPALRNAVIRRVQDSRHDLVGKTVMRAMSMMALQQREMILPALARFTTSSG